MPDVYRAPMRSRRNDIDPQQAIDRALALGLVGFGDAGADEQTARRVARFAEVADGSFVWTRCSNLTCPLRCSPPSGGGGRNFQQTHSPAVGEQTAAIWRRRADNAADDGS